MTPMRRSVLWGGVAFLAAALLVLLTLRHGIGVGMAEYNLTFLGLTVAGVAAWPLLLRRRVASLGLATMGTAAILTGFWLLYWKDELKADGLKDFAKFWHSVTSYALIPFFAAHFARNSPRFGDLTRGVTVRRVAAGAYAGGWAGLLTFGVVSWFPAWRIRFTDENYLLWAAWTWLVVIALVYFAWLGAKLAVRLRPRLAAFFTRALRRGLVDVTLLASFVLAMGTGFVLLYMKAFLHGNGYKYVSKYWHTSTSIVFTVAVVLHVGANIMALRAHARRVSRELDAPPTPP